MMDVMVEDSAADPKGTGEAAAFFLVQDSARLGTLPAGMQIPGEQAGFLFSSFPKNVLEHSSLPAKAVNHTGI